MATKWHPASGKWGPLGETSGSKQAREASRMIGESIADIQSRSGGINEYFRRVGLLREEEIEGETLSELEKFLNQSYNIKSESEEMASKLGFASVSTPKLDETMKNLRASQEDLIEDSRRKLEMSQLDLERKRRSEMFGLEDIIRNLELERRQYS
jgi:hypothetical protein